MFLCYTSITEVFLVRVAVIGSRGLEVKNLGDFLPEDTTEIVSGGARGVDTSARNYSNANGIKLTEFLPDYNSYGHRAPLVRNIDIINYSDIVLAFWDGVSRGTAFVITNCKKSGTPVRIYKYYDGEYHLIPEQYDMGI